MKSMQITKRKKKKIHTIERWDEQEERNIMHTYEKKG
jgi:hypothetical protein